VGVHAGHVPALPPSDKRIKGRIFPCQAEEKIGKAEDNLGRAKEKIGRAEDFFGLFFLPLGKAEDFLGQKNQFSGYREVSPGQNFLPLAKAQHSLDTAEMRPNRKKIGLPPCQAGRNSFKIICALRKMWREMRK